MVAFVPVRIVEDEQTFMWVAGIPDGTRVIVQGQDFVREGQKVEAVVTGECHDDEMSSFSSMVPKSGNRFSEKIMLKRKVRL